MEVRNTTKLPLGVPLPGGRKLRLGPGGRGNITPKAREHPPLAKLIEAGTLEVTDTGHANNMGAGTRPTGLGGSQRGAGGGSLRHTGDR